MMRTLTFFSTLTTAFVLMLAGQVVFVPEAHAQPVVTFTRVVENWPTIEIFFKAICDGQFAYPQQKMYYRVYENGVEIKDFTLWCPDPQQTIPFSAALVFDGSGSMGGAVDPVKLGGQAFIAKMDGVVDKAAVVFFGSAVTVPKSMTTNKTDLADAVNTLSANGASHVWDGIYRGVEELAASGSNSSRGVVVVTDGYDNGSIHTPDEIIALANKNRIQVYTMLIGSAGSAQFQTISLITGGRYYHVDDLNALPAMYETIADLMRMIPPDCIISYEAKCEDGGARKVDLSLVDFCRGSDTKTRSYQAPLDTSSFMPVNLEVGDATAVAGDTVSLPIVLTTPVDSTENWHPAVYTFSYDLSCLQFESFTAPPGSMLEGVSFTAALTGSGVSITTNEYVQPLGRTLLGYLNFTALNQGGPRTCTVGFDSLLFEAGCYKPVLSGGVANILDGSRPHIQPFGNQSICEGESIVLTATDGFTDYTWSTGATGKSITVTQAGSYWVDARDGAGPVVRSDTMLVTVNPLPVPVITASGSTALCPGWSVLLTATPGFAEYQWSHGAATRDVTVAGEGDYYVRVRDANGCWGRSNTVTVTHLDAPNPSITGNMRLCTHEGVRKYYTNSAPWWLHAWSVTGGTIVGRSDRDTVYVQWNPDARGTLTITQTESRTGCIASVTDSVIVRSMDATLNVRGDTTACGISSILLAAPAGYEAYLWSTGETTQSIQAAQDGDYSVTVYQDNCALSSDTIRVTLLESIPTTVAGPAIGCRGDDVVYTATHYPGAVYIWSCKSGDIVAGQGTSNATVNWTNLSTGIIRVDVQLGACVSSDSMAVTVHQVQKPNLALDGDTAFCEGDTLTVTATQGYAGYLWSTGDTTLSIRITQSGSYWVIGYSATGCTASSDTIAVAVGTYPAKPVITQSGDVLTCSVEGTSYEWRLDGSAIPGETSRTLVIARSGTYTVTVTNEFGCSSTSDAMVFTGIGTFAPALASRFDIAPNPNTGVFTVALEFARPSSFALRIVNLAGQTVYERLPLGEAVSWRETIRFENAAPGMYFFILESAGRYDFRKMVVR